MRRCIEFEIASGLDACCDEVWRAVSTMKGVNSELHPFVHMTTHPQYQALPTVVVPGRLIFRSWLLLFGVVPFDRHALALEDVHDGRGFIEESSSWLQSRWRHERSLARGAAGGCVVTDRLVIEPRLMITRGIVGVIVKQLFAHRHRQLRKRFGLHVVTGVSPNDDSGGA